VLGRASVISPSTSILSSWFANYLAETAPHQRGLSGHGKTRLAPRVVMVANPLGLAVSPP
jgi:hypothetical protein